MEAHLAIPCMDAIAAGGSHPPARVKELNTDHLMQLTCVYPIAQRECIGCTTLHAQVLVHSTSFDSTSTKKNNKTSVNRNNGVRDKSSFSWLLLFWSQKLLLKGKEPLPFSAMVLQKVPAFKRNSYN